MHRLITLALLCAPASLLAQQATVSPGMTRAQVESALGAPATARTVSEYSYLFYQNACGKACGMNDLVILRGDSVVDAIFRSPERHYTGQSSSPVETRPRVSARRAPAAAAKVRKDAAAPATKPASSAAPPGQIKVPAQAHDTRPSIPLNEPKMKPAAPATEKKTQPAPAKPAGKPTARKDGTASGKPAVVYE